MSEKSVGEICEGEAFVPIDMKFSPLHIGKNILILDGCFVIRSLLEDSYFDA